MLRVQIPAEGWPTLRRIVISRHLDAFEATKFAVASQSRRVREGRLVSSVAFQLICKFLYLVFPRDIHDSFGIVVETVAQKI